MNELFHLSLEGQQILYILFWAAIAIVCVVYLSVIGKQNEQDDEKLDESLKKNRKLTPRELAKCIENGEGYELVIKPKSYYYPCSKHGVAGCKLCRKTGG